MHTKRTSIQNGTALKEHLQNYQHNQKNSSRFDLHQYGKEPQNNQKNHSDHINEKNHLSEKQNHHHGNQDHHDDDGHGHTEPRTPQNQGKWKHYPTNVPFKTKLIVFILMSLVWFIAYVAVNNKKHSSHGHGDKNEHEEEHLHGPKHLERSESNKKTAKKKSNRSKEKAH